MKFASIIRHPLDVSSRDLLVAAEETQIHVFGWPIGVVITQRKDFSPKPVEDGIEAELDTDLHTYDYWKLKRNGEYFIYKSLFEDRRSENSVLFLDTRIVRTAEVLLRTARLYTRLGAPPHSVMSARIEYGGLNGRRLTVANPNRLMLPVEYRSHVDRVTRDVEGTLERVQSPEGLKALVHDVVAHLFEFFDFFSVSKEAIVDPTVDAFLQGRII
jgi:hypothetical protein